MSGQLHVPAALPPGIKPPGTHWILGWVDPSVGLDDVELNSPSASYKVNNNKERRGTNTQTYRQNRDRISLLSFFKTKK
jgi:hypothetical protein